MTQARSRSSTYRWSARAALSRIPSDRPGSSTARASRIEPTSGGEGQVRVVVVAHLRKTG